MSREDLVFTKRAMVTVAVLAVLGSQLITGVLTGLRLATAKEEMTGKATAAATAAAVAAVQTSVAPLEKWQAHHDGLDDARQAAVEQEQSRQAARLERLEQRAYGRN
jgi:hypothetical protein